MRSNTALVEHQTSKPGRPLSIDTNRTIIQKLSNCYLTAYEGGKDNPGLSLLRFNASRRAVGGQRLP